MVDDNMVDDKHTTVRFTDYAPAAFAELRSLAEISDQDYANAFALRGMCIIAMSNYVAQTYLCRHSHRSWKRWQVWGCLLFHSCTGEAFSSQNFTST